MAEALGIDMPLLIEQAPSEEILPLEEPDPKPDLDDEPPHEPGGSVH